MRELLPMSEVPPAPRQPAPGRLDVPTVFVPPAWEYKQIVRRPPEEAPLDEAELNALGAQGWELVSVHTATNAVHFYFKRLVR